MFKRLFLIVALASFGLSAHARTFYKSQIRLSVSYNALAQDTLMLLDQAELDVHYSDDHDYCYIYVGESKFTCLTYHPDTNPADAKLTMNRDQAGQMISEALGKNKCESEIHQSFVRLAPYLSDTIDVEAEGVDFYEQIHDQIPEAFHIWLFDLTQGVKY
ncbi:MAG: hypothetical protein KDD22_05645 [Bdellovibrionales bacterium]|nr:hypothetical protein [Bdellovibrionales bacterium]